MKTKNRKIRCKKSKKNANVQKETKILSLSKETTSTPENTPTRRTKATVARCLDLQNTTLSQNLLTTPQAKTTRQSPPSKAVEVEVIKEKSVKDFEKKGTRAKKEEADKTKMIKRKRKKKVKDDDEDYVVEEPHNEGDEKKKLENQFKSLRARTTVQSLYDATQSLSLERKGKIREMGFASIIRNYTNHDAIDRETLEMHKGKFGLAKVIQENDKETENETEVEKQKLKESGWCYPLDPPLADPVLVTVDLSEELRTTFVIL
ncbi:hypothetical protein Tco_0041090 [Tanacetum coccineum]